MRVSKVQQARNRAQVVAAAARLLRERGIAGIGVDALAEAAGLTHGAVYSHFRSKDDLAAAAVAQAIAAAAAQWHAAAAAEGAAADVFNRLVRSYVSRAHRDDPGQGCAVAAMGPDAMRHRQKVRRALSDGVESMIERFAAYCEGDSDDARRAEAIAAISAMVGAIVLARVVEDRALSDRILLTVRRRLMKM